jgi:sporulation protein YqfC
MKRKQVKNSKIYAKTQAVKARISEYAELPYDVLLNVPKITITGDIQVAVENHQGIIEYTQNRIRINTIIGVVAIDGEEMNIKNILAEEIIVLGSISRVEVVK